MSSPRSPPRKGVRCALDEGPNSKLVLVRVGEDSTEFYVHENVLRSKSDFFEKALGGEWAESKDREVKLLETEVVVFRIWVKWLYAGRVFLFKDNGQDSSDYGQAQICREWGLWRVCYALGSFIQDHDFLDALIDSMIEAMIDTQHYPNDLAQFIYPHVSEGSNHRKFAVEAFVKVWNRREFSKLADKQPRTFLQDVLAYIGPRLHYGVKEKSLQEIFDINNTCKYHDHARADKICYKKKPTSGF